MYMPPLDQKFDLQLTESFKNSKQFDNYPKTGEYLGKAEIFSGSDSKMIANVNDLRFLVS
jgi:hypothetical protein